MVMSINPCEECLVFPVCADMCNAKINYGMSLEVYVKACINRVNNLRMTDYVKYKKLQLSHREDTYLIEDRMRKRNENFRT